MISIFESRIKIYFVAYVQNPNQPYLCTPYKRNSNIQGTIHTNLNDQSKIYIHIYRFMSAFYQVNLILVHSSKDLFDSCLILLLLFFFSSRYYNETLNMKVNNHGSISSFASQVV